MKLVTNGSLYAVRGRFDEVTRYLDLKTGMHWWGTDSVYLPDCVGTKDEALAAIEIYKNPHVFEIDEFYEVESE